MVACSHSSVVADWQTALCGETQTFPASAPLTSADAAVQAQFGKACESIVKLEGLYFKEAQAAYLCRSFLNRDAPQAEVLAQFPAEEVQKADILAREGFLGKAFHAVVLTNAAGKPDALILRRSVLQPLLEKLASSAAAAAWGYLQGAIGEGFRPQALCHAMVSENDTGWQFDAAEYFINCKPLERLSFSVSPTGKIIEISRTERQNADGAVTAICVD